MSIHSALNTCVYATGRTLEEASPELIQTGIDNGMLETASESHMTARVVENMILHDLMENISSSYIAHSLDGEQFLSWGEISGKADIMSISAKECIRAFWELVRERAEREDQERSWEKEQYDVR